MSKRAKKEAKNRERSPGRRLKAMSDPLRARILRLLVERGVLSPTELARALDTDDVSRVSYHCRQLAQLGCAELVKTVAKRGAVEHFYRAIERHLIDFNEWKELDPLVAEHLVCDFMERILDDFVASRKADIVGSDQHFHITRTPMLLDEEGYKEGMEAFERCRLEMTEIEARSIERCNASETSATPVSSSLLFFKVPRESLGT